MARPLRVQFPNAWYHIMNRGAARCDIFKSDFHRNSFLKLLGEAKQMFELEIHAYCLMSNHYHLLVRTPRANISRAMRHVNGVYTQLYNRTQRIDGPLFRGRYKGKLVDDDCYQLIVSRYIHLNPVAAKLVTKPSEYKWSSYRAYLFPSQCPSWLSTNVILEEIASHSALRHIKNYQEYVEQKDISEINTFFSTKYTSSIIGSEVFKEKVLSVIEPSAKTACSADVNRTQSIPSYEIVIDVLCDYYKISRAKLLLTKRGNLNWPKLVGIYIFRKHFGYTLKSISTIFSPISHVTIGTRIQKCHELLVDSADKRREVQELVQAIRCRTLQRKT